MESVGVSSGRKINKQINHDGSSALGVKTEARDTPERLDIVVGDSVMEPESTTRTRVP